MNPAPSRDGIHRVPSTGQCRSAMEISCQTDVEYDTVIFNWRVNNFRRMRAMSIEKGIPPEGDVITSPIYVDVQGGQWWLRLYPYEDREEHRGKVSLFLHTDRATKGDVFFSFHFSALNEAGLPIEETAGGIDLHKFEKSDGIRNFGFYDLIENNETIDKALIDGHALWLFCEVYIYSSLVTSLDDVHDIRMTPPQSSLPQNEEKQRPFNAPVAPPAESHFSSIPPRQHVSRKSSIRLQDFALLNRGSNREVLNTASSTLKHPVVATPAMPRMIASSWKKMPDNKAPHASTESKTTVASPTPPPLRQVPTLGSGGIKEFTSGPRSSPLAPMSPSPFASSTVETATRSGQSRSAYPQNFTQPTIPIQGGTYTAHTSKGIVTSDTLRPSLGTLPNTLVSSSSAGTNGFRFTLQPPGPR